MLATLHRCASAVQGRKRYEYYDAIQSVPRKSADEIAQLQLVKLRALLAHAAKNVPYYARIFDESGFGPLDLKCVDDIKKLPTLDRDTVRSYEEELVARTFQKESLQRWSTGGSTGTPVSFFKEKNCIEREIALMWRSWSWSGWRPPERMVWIWGAPQETTQLDSLRGLLAWRVGGRLLLDAFDMGDEQLGGWKDKINAFGSEHVIGYATSLTTFAKYLLRRGIRLAPKFKQVISTAEKLRPEQRKIIEEAFGTQVHDQYGSREIRLTAFECNAGNMHIISDSCVMEFVSDEGVHDGAGRIVCTALNNFAMPLIRYEVGDYGASQSGACSCGIGFPLMKLDIGRVTDNFILPNGRVVHGEYFTHLMYGIDGIASFQFRQGIAAEVKLLIVLERPETREDILKKLEVVRHETEKLSPQLKLVFEFTDRIPPTRGGKHLFTVCEIAQD